MSDFPMKSYWMGQDIDELPREKLIEIIHHLSNDLEGAHKAHRGTLDMMRAISAARARL